MIHEIIPLIQSVEIESDGEVTLARALAYELQNKYEAVVCQGVLYLYDSGIWHKVERDSLLSAIQAFNGLTWLVDEKVKTVKLSHAKVMGIYNSLLLCRELLDDSFFDEIPNGVCFEDCFLSIQDGKLAVLKHSPDHKATMKINQNLPKDPQRVVPTSFLSFLDELFRGDPDAAEKVVLIRQFIGVCLAGCATDLQRSLLLYGAGGNGKSVLLDIIASCFDPSTVVSSSPSRWSEEYYISQLHPSSARINICSELPEQSKGSSSETFKQIISGDYVTGREAYGKPQTFRPTCGHIFAANSLPSAVSGDYSHGFFRRWIILELKREFTKEDSRRSPKEIRKSMEPERAAIIVWCLRSVSKVLETGEFTLPKSSEDVFSQWKEETNPVADFIASCAEMSESYEKFAYVYDEFKDWAMSAGRRSMSKIAFGRRLKECEVKMRRESTGKAVALRMKPRTEWLDFTHH